MKWLNIVVEESAIWRKWLFSQFVADTKLCTDCREIFRNLKHQMFPSFQNEVLKLTFVNGRAPHLKHTSHQILYMMLVLLGTDSGLLNICSESPDNVVYFLDFVIGHTKLFLADCQITWIWGHWPTRGRTALGDCAFFGGTNWPVLSSMFSPENKDFGKGPHSPSRCGSQMLHQYLTTHVSLFPIQ